MKYYIPTSSLNLDNILQAECISPAPYYLSRDTGYKSIEVIQELRGFNRIILFQYPVRFTIDDPNRYNYPMLIEVEDDYQLQGTCFQKVSNGIYAYSKTLYLTPTNCRLFFFSEHAYRLTTINTKSNKSIKYYENYQIFPTTTGLFLKEMPIIQIEEGGHLTDSIETQIDKKKGSLYAYLLGKRLSLSPKLAHQNRLTQDIYDMISGIIANPYMSEVFKTKLNTLLEEYKSVDIIEKENEQKFRSYLNSDLGRFKFLSSYLIDLLKKWDVWDSIYRKLSKKWDCNTLPLVSELNSRDDFKRLGEAVERHTEQSIANHRKSMLRPSLTSIQNNNQIYIEGLPFLTIAVNYIINNKITTEQLSAHRADICLGMINEIKTYYINEFGEDSWNKNVRTYVNNLYSHIQNIGFPFSIHSIENGELLAIAAFLLRGHNIDNYLTFLKMNEISDYCCPLMLWGALCGYMEMNKNVLSIVVNMQYYEEIYRCLFNTDMFKPEWKEIENEIKETNDFINRNDFSVFMDAISNGCKTARKDENIYKILYGRYGLSYELLDVIKGDKRLNNGKSVQKTVISNIEKLLKPSKIGKRAKKEKRNNDTKSLFPEIDHSLIPFFSDSSAWDIVRTMVPLQIREKTQKDFVWLQREYQKGDSSSYYAKASRENSTVIEALKRMLMNKDYVRGNYERDIEKVIKYLHSQYDKR